MYEGDVAEDQSSSAIVQPLVSIIGTYYDEYQKLKKKGKAPESIEEYFYRVSGSFHISQFCLR